MIDVPIKAGHSTVSCSLHIDQFPVSVLIIIYYIEKVLWWQLEDAWKYGYKTKSSIVALIPSPFRKLMTFISFKKKFRFLKYSCTVFWSHLNSNMHPLHSYLPNLELSSFVYFHRDEFVLSSNCASGDCSGVWHTYKGSQLTKENWF